jgi:hypothetical protein
MLSTNDCASVELQVQAHAQAAAYAQAEAENSLTLTQSFAIPGTTATILILGGIVLQLGGLGYMHVGLDYLWMLFLVLESAWNVVSMHGNLPWMQQAMVFWPLLLVGAGLGILLVAGGSKSKRAAGTTEATNAN